MRRAQGRQSQRAHQTSRGTRSTKDERRKGKGENDERDGDFDDGEDEDVRHMDVVPSPTPSPSKPPPLSMPLEKGKNGERSSSHADETATHLEAPQHKSITTGPWCTPHDEGWPAFPSFPQACQMATKRGAHSPQAYEHANDPTWPLNDLPAPPRPTNMLYGSPVSPRPTSTPDNHKKTHPLPSCPRARQTGHIVSIQPYTGTTILVLVPKYSHALPDSETLEHSEHSEVL
ncbi:hypothetical protein PAXINDRAFT_16610 [Paxillus involutus ATCC 200175]|uniref:Uncharacterized protein n=1 Tax=Paxillus involutus ATCC 200175 TaxID=664439 RepID=A0A0C9TRE1_PAXIN|nr:hypothetical protein PAXINDRAFT_16610 [Paxillus involutus ATCC 200175]